MPLAASGLHCSLPDPIFVKCPFRFPPKENAQVPRSPPIQPCELLFSVLLRGAQYVFVRSNQPLSIYLSILLPLSIIIIIIIVTIHAIEYHIESPPSRFIG
ncbi:hypothetical protein AA313_de0201814 [Arthrobotrys entomopaga]|nr:hypothetical protein AA313_de0201814 [Arthrobotrys entomopaga]